MHLDRRMAVVVACTVVATLTQCKKDPTAPNTITRTHSVIATASVPAVPTAPVTITTNDPESQAEVTFSVGALQRIVQAAGGPVSIKMTDMAPADFGSLPASERAQLGSDREFMVQVFDIARTSGTARALSEESRRAILSTLANQTNSQGSATSFKVQNRSGRRCTPGKVDFTQIFGTASTRPPQSIFIDNAFPNQNIVGSADVAYAVLHFIFCWECPRVTPTGGSR